jgi:phospholipid/cholesterol/gamma-HCH transport system substrate-binding protein
MGNNVVETVMGAVVLVIAAIFLTFAYSSSHIRTSGGYDLTARFSHIEGTRAGGDVRVSGIKVGTILTQTLDPKTFQAVVKMNIEDGVKLPTDTVATISSSGLLGDKFLELVPGADDKTLADGGEIKYTQAPMSLESVLGQAIFSMSGGSKSGDSAAAPAASAAPTPSVPPSHGPAKP